MVNPSVLGNEIFPDNYQVFRKDRADGYGGVLFAYLSNFCCTQTDVSTSCEAIVFKIDLSRDSRLIVLAAYRPPNSDREYFVSLLRKFIINILMM